MRLEVLGPQLSICKLHDLTDTDLTRELTFLARTEDELSLVCPTDAVPVSTLAREDGWRAFRVAGALDFSLVGVIAEISDVLARASIPLFVVSTFDTDYVLVRAQSLSRALAALEAAGHEVTGRGEEDPA